MKTNKRWPLNQCLIICKILKIITKIKNVNFITLKLPFINKKSYKSMKNRRNNTMVIVGRIRTFMIFLIQLIYDLYIKTLL